MDYLAVGFDAISHHITRSFTINNPDRYSSNNDSIQSEGSIKRSRSQDSATATTETDISSDYSDITISNPFLVEYAILKKEHDELKVSYALLQQKEIKLETYTKELENEVVNLTIKLHDATNHQKDEFDVINTSRLLGHLAAEEIILNKSFETQTNDNIDLTKISSYRHHIFVQEQRLTSPIIVEFLSALLICNNKDNDERKNKKIDSIISFILAFVFAFFNRNFRWHYMIVNLVALGQLVKSTLAMNYISHILPSSYSASGFNELLRKLIDKMHAVENENIKNILMLVKGTLDQIGTYIVKPSRNALLNSTTPTIVTANMLHYCFQHSMEVQEDLYFPLA